jgi:sensor histidine kinase regulating citrate/malate metabolism
MIFVSSILGIFLLTTVIFTSQLLRNMQGETISRLETDVKVLSYGLDSRKFQIQSDAISFASRQEFIKMVAETNKVALAPAAREYLLSKNLSSVIVIDNNGKVVARGEDVEQTGDSLSGDAFVKRGLSGKSAVSVIVGQGVLAPTVSVRAISPIVSSGKQVGAVITGISIDNAFVDGIKAATGLEAAVYGGDVLAATTQTGADGSTRWVGTKLQSPAATKQVLEAGEAYSGSENILNTPYFVSLVPLRDIDNVVVGMLFVGRPEATVLAVASDSLQATFKYSIVIMVFAIFPAYFVSKFLSDQLH